MGSVINLAIARSTGGPAGDLVQTWFSLHSHISPSLCLVEAPGQW